MSRRQVPCKEKKTVPGPDVFASFSGSPGGFISLSFRIVRLVTAEATIGSGSRFSSFHSFCRDPDLSSHLSWAVPEEDVDKK